MASTTVEIARPPDEVFAFVTDPTKQMARTRHSEVPDEGDCGDRSGRGNGRDNAGGPTRAGTSDNEVVVQVHASGFTSGELTWPSTWTDRLGRDRTPSIPGQELAGVVTALGYGTTGLSVGQRVFGLTDSYRAGGLRSMCDRGAQPRAAAGRRRLHAGREPADAGSDRVAETVRAWPSASRAERPRARRGRLSRVDGDAVGT
jgi:Alcohol dehydrogenase GroES-like domain